MPFYTLPIVIGNTVCKMEKSLSSFLVGDIQDCLAQAKQSRQQQCDDILSKLLHVGNRALSFFSCHLPRRNNRLSSRVSDWTPACHFNLKVKVNLSQWNLSDWSESGDMPWQLMYFRALCFSSSDNCTGIVRKTWQSYFFKYLIYFISHLVGVWLCSLDMNL